MVNELDGVFRSLHPGLDVRRMNLMAIEEARLGGRVLV